ncbi:MAG: peptidoglycan editing factor PgeF [Deltaproteobacteria bacterium]|nr:MAG: peptidoglycan editing factor PgeF [Deltaproteobacteria bacterium]
MFDRLGDRLVHGFSTRLGGVSRGRYAGLNLTTKTGDDPAAVAENLQRLATAAGFSSEHLVRVRQVHGARVVWARQAQGAEADGLCARVEDAPAVVGVHTADCVPLLLADAGGRAVAAVHAGWRGLVAGVIPAAVAALASAGVRPDRLLAAIGPCIEAEAFEVGDEVAARFPLEVVVRRPDWTKPHVDLVAATRLQLVGCGVPPEHVERVGGCTHTHPDRYFSYRRDGANMGQHLAFIGFRAG